MPSLHFRVPYFLSCEIDNTVCDLWDPFPAVIGCDHATEFQKPEFFTASFYLVLIILFN